MSRERKEKLEVGRGRLEASTSNKLRFKVFLLNKSKEVEDVKYDRTPWR
jgi:hypothetical protein